MASITVRVDDETKAEATEILDGLGLDLSSATRAFYRQIILHRGLPFSVTLPDERLTPAIEQRFVDAEKRMQDGTGQAVSVDDLFKRRGI